MKNTIKEKVRYVDIDENPFATFPDMGTYAYSEEDTDEGEKLSNILNYMKLAGLIKSYKDFALKIGESAVGLNDLKKGRKKLSVIHIKNMNSSYKYINTDYILFGEDQPFKRKYFVSLKTKDGRYLGSGLNEEMIALDNNKKDLVKTIDLIGEEDIPSKYEKLYSELLEAKNQLLEAKNQIISLKDELFQLKSKK